MNPDEQEFITLSSYIQTYLNPLNVSIDIETCIEYNPEIKEYIDENISTNSTETNNTESFYFDPSRTICLFAEHSNSNIRQPPYRALLTTPDRKVFKYNKFKPEHNTLFCEVETPGIYTFYTTGYRKQYKVYYSVDQCENSYVDTLDEHNLPERILMNRIDFTVHSLLTEILEGFSDTDMYDNSPY